MNTTQNTNECGSSVMHYFASQTDGEDEIVRLCLRHAEERGYDEDDYAGSAASSARCDEMKGN